MFKNCVFKPNVNTKQWFKKTGLRVIRTMAETAVAVIGSTTLVTQVDWKVVVSSTILSGIVTFLVAIKGLPEVESNE